MHQLMDGVELLAGGILFALFFWWGMAKGETGLSVVIGAARETNPVGFWLIQSSLAVLAIAAAISGLAVIFGLLPA